MKLSSLFKIFSFRKKDKFVLNHEKGLYLCRQVNEALNQKDLPAATEYGRQWYDHEMDRARQTIMARWTHSQGTAARIPLSDHLEELKFRLIVEFYKGHFDREQEGLFEDFCEDIKMYATACREREREKLYQQNTGPHEPGR